MDLNDHNMTKLTFLGTGTSQGVPMIGCDCEVCKSADAKDKRYRASVFVESAGLNVLVDAGPDFRSQMLRAGIRHIDAILLTHNHKDHTGGLDDVRAFNYIERAPIKIYCEQYVEDSLKKEYSYAFAEKRYPGVPEWQIRIIGENPFDVTENIPKIRLIWEDGTGYTKVPCKVPEVLRTEKVIPIRGMHYKLPVLGYRFGNIAYLTDMNYIPESEFDKLKGLEHFIINCVRKEKHISHFSLGEAVDIAERVGAKHSWLTHLSHQLPKYADLVKELPGGPEASLSLKPAGIIQDSLPEGSILPAFDGLVIRD